jgi:CRISPR-associated protein Cmr1
MDGTRSYISSGSRCQFEILRSPGAVDAETEWLLEKALWAWLNLGGIGAKNRKGFGSLRCRELPEVSPATAKGELPEFSPATAKDFEAGVREILSLGAKHGDLPAWTHLSSRAQVYIADRAAGSWEEALEWLGAWLIAFRRRYGYPGDARIFDGTPNADRDYEWAAPNGRHPRQGMPDRAGFGLPLPFKKKERGRELGETVIWGKAAGSLEEEREKEQDSRRASPLLLHVSRFGGDFVPVLTYLPAELLPDGGSLRFKGHPRKSFPVDTPQLEIVDRFLGDLETKKLIRKVTP